MTSRYFLARRPRSIVSLGMSFRKTLIRSRSATIPRLTILLRVPLRAMRGSFVAAMLAVVAASCGDDSSPILIGLAGPVKEPRGVSMELGARLAIDEINRNGGVRGRRLELVVRDDGGENQRAIAVAQELRDMPGIIAVIGHLNSGATLVAGKVYNTGENPVVSISPSASSPEVTGIGPWAYRVCPTDHEHGVALARYAAGALGARRVAAIYLNDPYGRGVFDAFRTEFLRTEAAVVTPYAVLRGVDVDVLVEHLQTLSGAQAVVLATDRATAVPILSALRARGVTLPVLGGDGLAGIEAEGAIAEGLFVSASYLSLRPGAKNAAFVTSYAAANDGAVPDHRGAGAYDIVYLLAQVMGEHGTDRDAVRRALDKVDTAAPFTGVTGRLAFDENGDVSDKDVLLGVVRSGRIQYAERQ